MAEQGCRIPLSIKVDRDAMYHNFIAPARAENRLNTLVVELLRAYYEVESVRDCVDKRMLKTEELRVMQEHIDKMLLEHVKTMTQTQTLQFETQQVASGVTASNEVTIINDNSVESEVPMTMLEMSKMLRAIANQVGLGGNLNGVVTEAVNAPETNRNAPTINAMPSAVSDTTPREEGAQRVNLGVSETVVKNETSVRGTVEKIVEPVREEVVEKVEKPVENVNVDTTNTTNNSSLGSAAGDKRRKRPSSFGKLCAGLEKTTEGG